MTGNEPMHPFDVGDFSKGLTIRQYFAVKALQAYISNPEVLRNYEDITQVVLKAITTADILIMTLNQEANPNDR